MELRNMEPADLEAVRALARQLGYDAAPGVMAEALARISAHPEHLAVVALDGRRVVGWLHALRAQLLYSEPFVEIASLVVDESMRGHGLGRQLMGAAEAWARGAGIHSVRIRSRLSRGGAHRFYVRLGYAKEKTQYTFARKLD